MPQKYTHKRDPDLNIIRPVSNKYNTKKLTLKTPGGDKGQNGNEYIFILIVGCM